jgi:RNA ligase
MTIHPARQMPFAALLAGLQSEISAGNVHEQAKGDLRLYCYSRQCQYERAWNAINEMARGLVLDVAAKEVVATPFPKFFNIGERAANDNFPALPFETFEKVDGSLIVIWYHGGKWNCSTKGSFDSEQAQKAQAIVDGLDACVFMKGNTYLAEYVGPDNRIVVHYDKSELVLLGAYSIGGYEKPSYYVDTVASLHGWRAAKSYQYGSIAGLVATAPTLPSDQEGFVIRFENGYRLKVKGDEYKRIHALISRCTPLAMWEAMRDGIDVAALRKELPEEFWVDFDAILAALRLQIDSIRTITKIHAEKHAGLSDKEMAAALSSVPSAVRSFIFPYRKHGDLLAYPKTRAALFRAIRPTGNLLPGYVPSYVFNRVMDEAA